MPFPPLFLDELLPSVKLDPHRTRLNVVYRPSDQLTLENWISRDITRPNTVYLIMRLLQ